MSVQGKQLLLCNCNRTMPVDGPGIAKALGLAEEPPVHEQLCRRELEHATGASGDLLLACTQEAKLFGELAGQQETVSAIRFVNIRENAGWSEEASGAMPKMAALLAAAAMPEPAPVASVAYRSQGQLLIVGPAAEALPLADLLAEALAVTVLATGTHAAELPPVRRFPVYSGELSRLDGWLGAFTARWSQTNPIDLDACTRCGACVRACPEGAIGWGYQIDLDRCRGHRACVSACGEILAIDFERTDRERSLAFDLVLDLRDAPAFPQHQPPQGYFWPDADALARARALVELTQLVGEFEKPKFFAYKESICAHGRSRKTGCSLCIEICSTAAIFPAGDKIRVEPHLCMGCGACATVCPSGALAYAYPLVPDLGARIKAALAAYRQAGGRDACVLLHGAGQGGARIAALARHDAGLPARMIPVALHHVAAAGLDVWLGTLAYGAVQVAVLLAGDEAPQYREMLWRQMQIGEAILQALGYQGTHFALIEGVEVASLSRSVRALEAALGVRAPASFNLLAGKRDSMEMALEHLHAHAPVPREVIDLPAGSPFGALDLDTDACTLCMSCVGACPEGALLDNPTSPQLKFIERRCVQCGLCVATCPENAIALKPRLALTREAKQARLLNEDAVFLCVSCGQPLGTQRMMKAMMAKISGHAMWQGADAKGRLAMCADCRVKDRMKRELM